MPRMPFVDEIIRRYQGGRERLFILHGNVGDLFPFTEVAPPYGGATSVGELLSLPRYLHRSIGKPASEPDQRIWLWYQLRGGMLWLNSPQAQGEARIAKLLGASGAEAVTFSRKPLECFAMVDEICRRKERLDGTLTPPSPLPATASGAGEGEGKGEGAGKKERIIPLRMIVTDAHLIVPDAASALMRPEDRELLVLLKRFAADPDYDETDTFIVLVTDALSGIHRELREVAVTIEIPRPNEAEIASYLEARLAHHCAGGKPLTVSEAELPQMRQLAVGLSRRQVENVLVETRHAGETLSAGLLGGRRKELVRRDFGEFLEYFEPDWGFDVVGGSQEAVAELAMLADAFKRGDRDIPAGVILAGQNGIGKTFLFKAFLGSSKASGVVVRPFFDSLLGASERNWERIAIALRSAGQIVVGIDEADAQMGQRTGPNVHEVSKRVFSMQMQLMGDPAYRGKILWVLMTCRPDKLAPDVKRPGRCERVIPLFPLTSNEDAQALVTAQMKLLARKDGYVFAPELASRDAINIFDQLKGKTGAQIERLLRRAKRKAGVAPIGIEQVLAVLAGEKAFNAEPEAYLLQRLIATVEAVETENEDLIPPFYRDEITKLGGLEKVKDLIEVLRRRIDGV